MDVHLFALLCLGLCAGADWCGDKRIPERTSTYSRSQRERHAY